MSVFSYNVRRIDEENFVKALAYRLVTGGGGEYSLDIRNMLHHYGADEVGCESNENSLAYFGDMCGENVYRIRVEFRKTPDGILDEMWLSMEDLGSGLMLLKQHMEAKNLVEANGGLPVYVRHAGAGFRINERAVSRLMYEISQVNYQLGELASYD